MTKIRLKQPSDTRNNYFILIGFIILVIGVVNMIDVSLEGNLSLKDFILNEFYIVIGLFIIVQLKLIPPYVEIDRTGIRFKSPVNREIIQWGAIKHITIHGTSIELISTGGIKHIDLNSSDQTEAKKAMDFIAEIKERFKM